MDSDMHGNWPKQSTLFCCW